MPRLNIAFFASHGGSNMQSIIDSIKEGKLDAKACVVISNNSKSGAAERAGNEGIPFEHISSLKYPSEPELAKAMLKTLKKYGADTIVLAGYMKKLPTEVIKKYKNRIFNIHPALLPKFGGKGMYGINVHKAVLDSGDKFSGPTIHLVDEIYDNGKIIAQRKVPVHPDDTPEELAARVLKEEHRLYPETLQKVALGEIDI